MTNTTNEQAPAVAVAAPPRLSIYVGSVTEHASLPLGIATLKEYPTFTGKGAKRKPVKDAEGNPVMRKAWTLRLETLNASRSDELTWGIAPEGVAIYDTDTRVKLASTDDFDAEGTFVTVAGCTVKFTYDEDQVLTWRVSDEPSAVVPVAITGAAADEFLDDMFGPAEGPAVSEDATPES